MDDGGCILFSCRPPLAEFGNCGVELGLVRVKEKTTTKDTEFSNQFGGEFGRVRANRGGGLELSLIKVKENTTLNDTEFGNRTGVEVGGSNVKEKIELSLVRVKEYTVDNVSLPHRQHHVKCSIWPSGIAEMEPSRRIHDSFRDGNENQTRRLYSSSIGDGNEKQGRKQSSSSIGEKQARRDTSSTGDGNEKQDRNACSLSINDGNKKHDRRESSSKEDGNEKQGQRFNSSSTGDDREKQATKQKFSIVDGNEKQVERPDLSITEGSEKQARKQCSSSFGYGSEKQARRLYSCLEDGNEKDSRRQKSSTGDQNETQARREWNEKEARRDQKSSLGDGNEKQALNMDYSTGDGNEKQTRDNDYTIRDVNKMEGRRPNMSIRNGNENEVRNKSYSFIGDGNEKQALNMDYSTGDGNEKQTRDNDYSIRDVNKMEGRRPNMSIRDGNEKEVRNKSYSSIRDGNEKQARRSNLSIGDGKEMQTRVHNSSIEDVNKKQIKWPTSFIGDENEKQGKSQISLWDVRGVGHSLVELNAKHDESMNEVAEVTQGLCVSVSLEEGKRENELIPKELNYRKTFLSISQVSEDLIPVTGASEESQKPDMSISLEERKRNLCNENSSKVHQRHQNKSHSGDIEGIKTHTKIRNKKLKNESDLTIQETVVSRRPMLGHEGINTKNDASEYNKESLHHLNKAEKYRTYPDSHSRSDRSHYSRRSHSREHRYKDRGLKQKIKQRKTSIDHGSRYCRSHSRDHRDHGTYHDHRISKRDLKGRRHGQNDYELDYSSRKNSHQGRKSLDVSTCRITESESQVRRDGPHNDRDLHKCGGYHKIRERLYESRTSFNHEESFKHPNDSDKCISRSSLSNKIDTHVVDSCKDNSSCLDKHIDRRSSSNKDDTHIVDSHKEYDRNSNKCSARSSLCNNDPSHDTRKNGSFPTCISHVERECEQQDRKPASPSYCLEVERQSDAIQKEGSLVVEMDVQMDLSPDPVKDIKETFFPLLDHGTDDWPILEHARLPNVIGSLKHESINNQCLSSMAIQNTFQNPSFFNHRSVSSEGMGIDKRVEYLMQGFTLVQGREEEVILDALTNATKYETLDHKQELDDESGVAAYWNQTQLKFNDYCFNNHQILKESVDAETTKLDIPNFQSSFQTSQMWTARGGDWKLIYEFENSDNPNCSGSFGKREKIVLNKGIPLCERRHWQVSDPRIQSSLYGVSTCRTFEMPQWAYQYWEETNGVCVNTLLEKWKTIQTSISCTPRSQILTPRDGVDFDSSKKSKANKVIPLSEGKVDDANSAEGAVPGKGEKDPVYEKYLTSARYIELEQESLQKVRCDNIVVDKRTVNSFKLVQKSLMKEGLKLDKGDWFYLDGKGQEVGPSTYLELQLKAQDGLLYGGTSVYRKCDKIWVPLTVDGTDLSSRSASSNTEDKNSMKKIFIQRDNVLSSFHELFPQFIGYMCGKLHEHVMKSYKSREFSAMLHEGSRSCFRGKKSREVSINGLTITSNPGQFQFGNSSSPAVNESLDMRYDQDKFVMKHREMGISPSTMDDMADSRNDPGHMVATNEKVDTWSLIEPQLLMRVFRFLESDIRSLVLASIICKQWRAVFISFKKQMIQIDLSSLGSLCSDDIFQSLTEDTQNVSRVILRGCTTLSPSVVKAYLQRLQYIEHIDAKGCDQLKEFTREFPQKSFSRYRYGALDSHQKYKSTKVFGERKSSSISKHSKFFDDGRARRLNFTSVHLDEVTEPVSYPSHGNSDASQVRSSENAKRLKSLNKLKKLGPDRPHHKLGSKEQNSYKHKQVDTSRSEVTSLSLMKEESSPVLDGKLEKDMAFVLQNLKEAKVPDGRKVSSDGPRASAYREIEDKLRRGLYPSTIRGFRTFKSDLLSVARMLFRGKDKEAGTAVLGNTFRLIAQLDEEFKCRDIALSNPHKRKYEEYKSGSSLVGRKRGIENIVGEPGFEKRRRNYDGSNGEDGYSFTRKTKTFGTDDEDNHSSHDDDKNPEKLDSEVESEDKLRQEKEFLSDNETDNRIWGARMTKASMVPPATRKYKLIEEYVIVADEDEVKRRMQVSLPKDYDKIVRAQKDSGIEFSHLEMPELREYKPRKRLQYEVLEQEVYGIDPYTHNLLMDSMPTNRLDFPDSRRHLVIEDLLKALNQEVRQFTGDGKAPTKFPLERVVNRALNACIDFEKRSFISALAKNMWNRMARGTNDSYVAYRKGLGVVCNHPAGFEKDEFIVEFFGEVYPAWRWYEKQDAIRAFQKQDQEAAPEFYNIFLERPKGDAFGYDLVVVDAMHKANYASRICHSCRPNCEARVTAVNGKYQIGVYTLRRVDYGEELTFDYNSITESKEEHEKSVCLCGSNVCRGSYLNFAGPDTFQEVMKSDHGVLHRYDLLLQACTTDAFATKDDWDVLSKSGLGVCLLDGLPHWMIKYTAGVMRFLNEERQSLPREILKAILSERGREKAGESEVLDAEIQADGVFNTRLQNLAITLDKVRYIFKKLYGDPKGAPPPLRKLDLSEIVGLMWKNKNSVVAEVLHGMAQHTSKEAYSEFMFKVHEHEPLESGDILANLHQSLLWLRDELCKAPITCASRHDAAADLIHVYAHTQLFFTSQDYPTVESPPLTISPLDLGPKHAYKLGTAPFKKWVKTYSKDYVLGQLIFWYKPNEAEPGASLAKASRGCLILPDPTSCYAKSPHHRLSYSSMDRLKMLRRMERESQRQWNWKGQHFWEFKESWHLLGSPMMDAVHTGNAVNKEMMDWLKRRTRAFVSPWDNQ